LGNTITREKLLEILSGLSYNLDGSVNKDSEVVRNYTINVIDGKVHIDLFTLPVEIKVDGEWKNIDEAVAEEDKSFLYEAFMERHLMGKIILDTDDPTGISVRSRDRVRHLPNKIQEAGIELPREFSWVDGAKDISGVIILPQDDYDKVFIATDPDDDGYPEIVFIPPKTEENQERPYYEKKDGKTYIYVNHFSGGGGTQASPYIVSNETDLNNVRNNLGAYYIQDADILMTSFQTGSGFQPIGNNSAAFTGYYDGRGYEIKDLFINRPSEDYVGLFGYQSSGIIKRVKLVNVNITGRTYVGALAGRSNSTVQDCAVLSGTVKGYNSVGGLVGYRGGGTQTRCYSHVEVKADNDYLGGHVGYIASGTVDKCFSTGKVIDLTIAQTIVNKGGFLGYLSGGSVNNNCFWDIETSGMLSSSGGAIGKTTADMKNQATFSSAGWDFDLDFKMGGSKMNRGYPENQRFIRFAKGKGTVADPYLIYTEEDLKLVRHYLYANFRLMDDIKFTYSNTGQGFTGIGVGTNAGWDDQAFSGVFDGNGRTIGNLFINRATDNVGLFRYINGGTVKDLEIVDANVIARDYAGILAGYVNNATIDNVHVKSFNTRSTLNVRSNGGGLIGALYSSTVCDCSVDVNIVSTGSYTGGLIGYMYNSVNNITRCKTKGRIDWVGSYTGGLIGFAKAWTNSNGGNAFMSTVSDCITNMEVNGGAGFIGRLEDGDYPYGSRALDMKRCISLCTDVGSNIAWVHSHYVYSSGWVSYVTDCFYDRQLSNTTGSGFWANATTPKYTAELKSPLTYSTAWDFTTVWILDPNVNDGYPELRKFAPPVLPILGFRNEFGNYYTDAQGNIIRYLEYGTIVAGDTSDAKPVWLQNNADFAIKDMKVWVDPATVANGITVELSLSDHPFTPVDEIVFPGTVPIGDSRKFYVRFVADITVNSGGTFDLKAKASPV
jgi:hypothetical protein